MKTAYLGPKATYSEQAAEIFAGFQSECVLEQYPTIYDALNSVINKNCDNAVIPIENSIEGSVNVTLDMLAQSQQLIITGEILIPIRHCLMVKNNIMKEEIELILSHQQALAQCSKYIAENFSGIETRAISSTAEGARQVAGTSEKWAAIGNVRAAEIYNLRIIQEDIQDCMKNTTRFVIISSTSDNVITGKDKTSVVFSVEDKPGSLYKILDIFNLWDLNLTKIESRPSRNEMGNYIFFVDLEGHKDNPDVRDALTMIKRKTSFFRLLGSYSRLY